MDFIAGFSGGLDNGKDWKVEVGFCFAKPFWVQPYLAAGNSLTPCRCRYQSQHTGSAKIEKIG